MAGRADFVQVMGTTRRSQGVFTFGVGAIVDFTMGSFMPLGLDNMDWWWSRLNAADLGAIQIHEPRLERLLKVTRFRSLPVPAERDLVEFGTRVRQSTSIPCIRFPRWLECPRCHRLGTEGDPFEIQPTGEVKCTSCVTDVNPVRFVVICAKHHIADFPWVGWAHAKSKKPPCASPKLYLRSTGKSVALADLTVECAACEAKNGLASIFRPNSLKSWSCNGDRPWLRDETKCGGDVEVVQRGAANAHFGVTASMLSIPPASEAASRLLEPQWPVIESIAKALPRDMLAIALKEFLSKQPITQEVALDWILRRLEVDKDPEGQNEERCRHKEFRTLSVSCLPAGGEITDFENEPFKIPALQGWFSLASAVRRLREVRAYVGFTRGTDIAAAIEDMPRFRKEGRIAPVCNSEKDWLPGIEVKGEGVFLVFDEAHLEKWLLDTPAVVARASKMNALFVRVCEGRGYAAPYPLTARRLLVHGFAHAFIRRLSLDCGYSSASLRERLYVSEPGGEVPAMAGLLVYTASTDSDGSLGGLVNLATPERLVPIIKATVQDLQWCGSDPVCIETPLEVQGDRVSGASCHGCLLVPETACECFNRELDRVVLVGGGPDARELKGYFESEPT